MGWHDLLDWFRDLKNKGVSKEELLDILEFDSDQYPDYSLLVKARDEVYK